MEKVENLYRSARTQNDSIDTSGQIGSRLRLFRDDEIRAVKRHPPKLRCRRLGALVQTSEQSVSVARQLPPISPPEAATAGSRPLPDMRIFAAEFFEYCADRRSTPEAFAKVQAFGAKLLAMQRASL